MKKYIKNMKGYKVKTPNGYKEFSGIAYMGDKPIYHVEIDNDLWVDCTYNHKFFTRKNKRVPLYNLQVGSKINTTKGLLPITKIEKTNKIESVYDLIEVGGNHSYYTNGIVSSNCEFISFEETLVSARTLKMLKGSDPIDTIGRTRWYHPIQANKIYLAGLDPSMGTGGDNAAITIWQLPEFVQVAEWKHNETGTKEQIRILIDMLTRVYNDAKNLPTQNGKPEIYWSVENNSLGEAALQVIEATGEDRFPGDFVHEPMKKRKGFTTTHKTKIEACVRLKELVESDKMTIKSKPLIQELKGFIRSNRSYSAKPGSADTDDVIMSLILCIRILNEIQNWDDKIYDTLADVINLDEEDDAGPMPSIFM